MTEQEFHAAYDLDPDGHNTCEAVDRIKQLQQYLDIDFLDSIDIDDREMADFDLADDLRLVADTEMWADTHGFKRMANLARTAQARLQTIEAFSVRLIRQTRRDAERQFKEDNDLRPWDVRIQDGDFAPEAVITAINDLAKPTDLFENNASSDLKSAEIFAEFYAEGLYPFVAKLVRDATNRYDGSLARALEAQFTFPLKLDFVHYRGASARLIHMSDGLSEQNFEITIFDAPNRHHFPHMNNAATRQELLTWLHCEVDKIYGGNRKPAQQ